MDRKSSKIVSADTKLTRGNSWASIVVTRWGNSVVSKPTLTACGATYPIASAIWVNTTDSSNCAGRHTGPPGLAAPIRSATLLPATPRTSIASVHSGYVAEAKECILRGSAPKSGLTAKPDPSTPSAKACTPGRRQWRAIKLYSPLRYSAFSGRSATSASRFAAPMA